ncbi:substrate-binding domain-containing protein [Bacillus sp. B15-48]|uniref:substrate-binding domain-containing protein n=1 Tax=Bacillus sp. B15-48 TaxID=1548601 RepID=UPI00193F3E48|nr:substrate-binding domain-containing protein [Bacillus sp. B15-48]MBM4763104.1 ABC transporter substrate-binding protein [Bacillus sp. B15-48]
MVVKRKSRYLKTFLILCIGLTMIMATACSGNTANSEEDTIKIGVLASLTGPLETYGKQTVAGFELGLQFATEGTNEVAGKKIKFLVEDTETKPDVAVRKATKLLEEDEVDFLVGSSSSGDTLAVLPLAEEYGKIMVVEPAVADSITGKNWNKYIFRTGRNSSQDAVAGAAAIAKKDVRIATFAQDNAYGREGVAAFKEGAEKLGATIVNEQYADPNSTDFTANIQSIINEKPDYLYIAWAGSNAPWKQLKDMRLEEQGIKISTAAQDIASLRTMDSLIGMSGFSIYYHTLPDNEVNDWLVEEHKKKFNGEIPDLFTAGGMTAAIAIVEALKKTSGNNDVEGLIETMENMEFETPKGTMKFRAEDHQALQSLYAVTLEEQEAVDHPVPVLIRELNMEETEPPVRNGK